MIPQAHSPKQKTPFGSPDPSWGIATGTLAVTTRAPICSGLGALGGGGSGLSSQPSSPVCGLHLPPPSSWWWGVQRGYSLCSQSSDAPRGPALAGFGVGGCLARLLDQGHPQEAHAGWSVTAHTGAV